MDYVSLLKGDARFFWPENLNSIMGVPQAWDATLNTGIGQPDLATLWITSYLHFTAFFHNFGLDWNQILIIFWIVPAVVCAFFSTYKLFTYFFSTNKLYCFIAGLIYVSNTYFLLLFFGGQMGVILAYSIVPLTLLAFIKLLEKNNLFNSLSFALVLGIQILFDPRLVYMTIILLLGYYLWMGHLKKLDLKKICYIFLIPLFFTLLFHIYWLLPLLVYKTPSLPQSYDNFSGFKFFSFATFSNAFGMLHPNWPDNIFGKISFMRGEFLIFPILAFSSLLFINSKKPEKNILFFSILALGGIFMAKGMQEPFGFINGFIFEHIPGMQLFRDPTKWYLFIVLAYSILIPFSLSQISKVIANKNIFRGLIPILFIFFWVYLINIIFINHKFLQPQPLPKEYVQLKDFLEKDNNFSRTIWIPQWQRFGFFSDNHPAIGRGEILGNGSPITIASKLKNKKTQNELKMFSVKYIIVPFDSEGEIFLNDSKYDDKQYQKTIAILKQTPEIYLKKQFGKIVIFELPNPDSRFSLLSGSKQTAVNYTRINNTEYKVYLNNVKPNDRLIFSENFDHNWVVINANFKQQGIKYKNNLNSFILPKEGTYTLKVYYQPQAVVNEGLIVSVAAFLSVIIFLIYKKLNR